MNSFQEPPINPDEDTTPSIVMRPVEMDERIQAGQGGGAGRWIGLLSLLGAAGFALGTMALLMMPSSTPQPQEPTAVALEATSTQAEAPTELPTLPPTVEVAEVQAQPDEVPEVAVQDMSSILQAPLGQGGALRAAYQFNPFTIISGDRPRSEFIEYVAVQGDTINEIALRYNLEQESIAWCNDRSIVLVLRPGDVLQIPPVDGACHTVLGTREETIRSIAEQYNVENVFDIIDSQYNPTLGNVDPDVLLPGGLRIFIPGGEGEPITWNPGRELQTDASGNVIGVNFAPGQSGSCGNVTPGGGAFWTNPLPNGTWVRGFYAGHTGIDLSAPTGTPILAANSGNVLYSGWNSWGYGYTVVLEHGPAISTLYGHMQGQPPVSCGQFVTAGTVIGYVGSTGNSSGPHLHFEIRSGDTPTDPTATAGVGW
jgi:murein DD-endopeptidase MepM/ murein hydrolase activator NlpD